ncbi:hypothetical protein FS837_005472, partial [Tulasnella sp. UAMH 9824]
MFFGSSKFVERGDVLVIPAPNDKHKNDANKITIHWKQWFSENSGDYYLLTAKNRNRGDAKTPFYIQAEWYNEPGFNSAYNMRRIDDDNYEITIDDRHQYAGEDARFIVWHDKDRKPYADRFVQHALVQSSTYAVKTVLDILPLNGDTSRTVVEGFNELGQNLVG